MKVRKRYVILDSIRSAHNVGSVFRTAEGAGVSKIFLCGYTPAPVDRFGRLNKEIAKTSLGASEIVPYEIHEDVVACIASFKGEGVHVVAVEQTDSAIEYQEHAPEGDVAFIFGNEVTGVSPEALAHADSHIHIPMNGVKESLNVSVCAGIILFHYR